MAKPNRIDYLYDDSGDILIENGDFVTGLSDDQHVADILSANKGDYRQFPTVGVNMANFLKKQDNNLADLKRQIQVNLEADGYKLTDFNISSKGDLSLDYEPNY